MAKTDTPTKYMVYRMMKKEHQIELKDEQLNTIDDVYLLERKSVIFRVGIYRSLNAWWSILLIILFYLIRNVSWNKYVFVALMVLFFIYNIIHIWNNIVEYRSLKSNKLKNGDLIDG